MWTYISVGEQSFNHRVVVSRYPLCFQHQVEADVCAVTVAGEKHHSVTERDSLSCESTIQSQLTWDKVAALSSGNWHPLGKKKQNKQGWKMFRFTSLIFMILMTCSCILKHVYTSKKLVVWFQPEIYGCGFACGRVSGVKIWAAESSLLTNKAVSSAPQVWVSSPFIMIKGWKHRGTYNTITICFPR